MKETTTVSNEEWRRHDSPFFTIITPIYNRRNTIRRTLKSVDLQSFRDIEYIIVDDGSTESCDDIIEEYMGLTTLPVLYIKKENGGVHTARNMGYRYANGKLLLCIDSDDELTPDACQIFHDAWFNIPKDLKEYYWQIKGLCVDQEGSLISQEFPENINTMGNNKARQYFSFSIGERFGCRVTRILKENPFPEPVDVKFIEEDILWTKLEKEYLSYGINSVVRVYHKEGNDHLSGRGKKTIQTCKNAFWNSSYKLDQYQLYFSNIKSFLLALVRYQIMEHILKQTDPVFVSNNKVNKPGIRVLLFFLWLPGLIVSRVYKYKMMQ